MILEVISIRKSLFKGEVDSLIVPGANGLFTVLPRHVSIMSILIKGDIVYTIDGKDYKIAIDSGFIEVCNNVVVICVGDEEQSSMPKSDEKYGELGRGEDAEKD